MNSFAGRLVAHLGLDSAQFQRGLQLAQTQSRGFAAAFAGARRLITPVTAAFAAATAAAAAFTIPAMRAAAEIDEIAKAARRVDGSFEGWSAARLAASEAGVAVETLADQVQSLNARLAQPNAATTTALRQLGLSAEALRLMDVDARLGAIADRVQALGLDSGQTTRILRNLGITSREMAGLIGGGAAALAAARAHIRDYGLAISAIDTARIEEANDRIGRLGLVSRYMGQQLAVAVVPALGRLAQAFTESLREGGILRGILDGIAGTVAVVTRGVESLVVIGSGFVRWVRELGSALMTSAPGLQTAVDTLVDFGRFMLSPITTIFRLVTGFADLIRGAGGFGEALTMLGKLAAGVWEGIVGSSQAIGPALNAVWQRVQADFFDMLSEMTRKWGEWLNNFAAGLRVVEYLSPGFIGQAAGLAAAGIEALTSSTDSFRASADSARQSSETWARIAGGITTESFSRAAAAMNALQEAVARGAAESAAAIEAQRNLNFELAETENAGASAARGLRSAADAARELQSQVGAGADAILGLIPAAQRGGREAGRYILQLIQQIIMAQLRLQMIQAMAGRSGGGVLGALGRLLNPAIPSFATGVQAFRGGLARINERGGELVSLPGGSTVIPHDLSKRMLDGAAGGGEVLVLVRVENDGALRSYVERTTGKVVARVAPSIVRDAVQATHASFSEVRPA